MNGATAWIGLVDDLLLLLLVGVLYFWFAAVGRETVTFFLRTSPGWFFYPVIALGGYVALLVLHLYVTN